MSSILHDWMAIKTGINFEGGMYTRKFGQRENLIETTPRYRARLCLYCNRRTGLVINGYKIKPESN